MKVLIAYGTRYGATTGNAEEIGRVLVDELFDVRIVNVKKAKIKDISEYDLVIVGSGMRMFRWVGEVEKFLKKFQKDLRQMKTAIFVSSGAKALFEYDGDTMSLENAWQKFLVEKAEKYSLEPISMAMFGGVWDYNKMGSLFRRTMEPFKMKLREAGIEETSPGVFDTRDLEEVSKWTKELVEKVRF